MSVIEAAKCPALPLNIRYAYAELIGFRVNFVFLDHFSSLRLDRRLQIMSSEES
jgi:hypothetical protein